MHSHWYLLRVQEHVREFLKGLYVFGLETPVNRCFHDIKSFRTQLEGRSMDEKIWEIKRVPNDPQIYRNRMKK